MEAPRFPRFAPLALDRPIDAAFALRTELAAYWLSMWHALDPDTHRWTAWTVVADSNPVAR